MATAGFDEGPKLEVSAWSGSFKSIYFRRN
jgi:hypothetical protein